MSVFRLLLILLLCVQAVVGVVLIDVKEWFPFFLINSLLLLLQLLVLKLVFKIKNEAKKVSLLNGAMGVGDVFFFFFLAEAFSPLNFVAFLVLSLIVSLLFHYLFRRNPQLLAQTLGVSWTIDRYVYRLGGKPHLLPFQQR